MNSSLSAEIQSSCPEELVTFSRDQIQAGSKSFNFASFFFSQKERRGAWLLYSWCRFCDDEIDRTTTPDEAQKALIYLLEQTAAAYHSERTLTHPAFAGLQWVVREFGIPEKYPRDLLRGMRMDVEGQGFETLEDLEDYCYCVAGVVGLMMCHIMGVSRNEALANAVAMGSAMQLTNISRDVDQDFAMGRIYFPKQWLQQLGIQPKDFNSAENRQYWHPLALRLLEVADQRYQVGVQGLNSLSFRAALAVAIAGSVYRQIGVKVKHHGPRAWDQRRYVGKFEKIGLAVKAAVMVACRLVSRLWKPWRATPIQGVWGEPS